jgi:hypothetical protein
LKRALSSLGSQAADSAAVLFLHEFTADGADKDGNAFGHPRHPCNLREKSGRRILFSFRPDDGGFSSPTEMRFRVMGAAFRTP